MFAGALVVSESPRWLALRQRTNEAVKAVQTVQGVPSEEAQRQVDRMVSATMAAAADSRGDSQTDTDVGVVGRLAEITSSPVNRQVP